MKVIKTAEYVKKSQSQEYLPEPDSSGGVKYILWGYNSGNVYGVDKESDNINEAVRKFLDLTVRTNAGDADRIKDFDTQATQTGNMVEINAKGSSEGQFLVLTVGDPECDGIIDRYNIMKYVSEHADWESWSKNLEQEYPEVHGKQGKKTGWTKTAKVDTITMDVPLFIRVLELAREDVKDDMALHDITTVAVEKCQNGKTLTMKDYDAIASVSK